MMTEAREICMFFVDDSNIWIEARKFAASGNSHMPKLTGRDLDPRLRINVGRLVKTICGGRIQGTSFLYGSRPPPNDKVWKIFEKANFRTKIYDRAHGKEKQVDSAMATDLSSEATKLSTLAPYDADIKEKNERTHFVAITGDRDMLPPIRKVLDCGFRVELWAWKSGISAEYFHLANDTALLTVAYLDGIFKEISFTSYLSTRPTGKVVPGQTLVLGEFANPEFMSPVTDNLKAVCDELIEWGHLFYITQSKTGNELFVEFSDVMNIYDMDDLIAKAKTQFEGIWTVRSWPEYANRFNVEPPAMVETRNLFSLLEGDASQKSTDSIAKEAPQHIQHRPDPSSTTESPSVRDPSNPWKLSTGGEHSGNAEASSLNDPDDSNIKEWKTVKRTEQEKGHHRKMQQGQACPDGIRCGRSGECGRLHTDKEHDLFQAMPRQNFKKWKTSKCNYGDRCNRGERCAYYHTPAEAWCLRCRCKGHSREECIY